MKILVATFMVIHGLLHLVGASKALDIALSIKMPGRSQQLLWIAACLIFILAASLLLVNKQWWLAGAAGVLLSQFLIIRQWQDAKYGTILNLIILLILVAGLQ